jgi:hypothetical protein
LKEILYTEGGGMSGREFEGDTVHWGRRDVKEGV